MKNDFTNRPAYKQSAGILTGSASVFFYQAKAIRDRGVFISISEEKKLFQCREKLLNSDC